jgi:hypothetical protein
MLRHHEQAVLSVSHVGLFWDECAATEMMDAGRRAVITVVNIGKKFRRNCVLQQVFGIGGS